MDRGVNIPWIGGKHPMGRGVKIPWIGSLYTMGRGQNIIDGGSKSHG
jgi:hypothetical protein